ncbi:MAG: nucleotide exchange factor GrpE [Holosporales bacterium]|jgi:molecular chaperone GrpE|nr:nucleotide exchange factor GrpE [Holosporales bacterium]
MSESKTEQLKVDASNGDALKEKLMELEDKLLRALAEVENIKKRADKDREDVYKYGISSFAKDVLTIRDNLKLALSTCGDKNSEIADGIKMVLSEMDKILSKHSIRVIEALNKQFDPHLHQAMFETSDTGKEPGVVVEVVQDGFMINDRLLRPAFVGVSKK